jgi:hypothetical protein
MAVMQVRQVRMVVVERRVPVPVRVRLTERVPLQVAVLMVLIVDVTVVVFQGLLHVCVGVPFTNQ